MAQVDREAGVVKLVLAVCGRPLAGKTTLLEELQIMEEPEGGLTSVAGEGDRVVLFDCSPRGVRLGESRIVIQLRAAVGATYYRATRRLLVKNADGLLFLADSQAEVEEENVYYLDQLCEDLAELGVEVDHFMRERAVFMWNKRDLPELISTQDLYTTLNRWEAPCLEACVPRGLGVRAAYRTLLSRVLSGVAAEHGLPLTWEPAPPEPEPTLDTAPQRSPSPAGLAAPKGGAEPESDRGQILQRLVPFGLLALAIGLLCALLWAYRESL